MEHLSAAEWADWMAFDALEPIGARRLDVLAAVLGSIVANQWRGKDSKPVTPAHVLDLLPWNDPKGERRRLAQADEEGGNLPVHPTVAAYEQLLEQMNMAQEQTDGTARQPGT